MIDQRTRRAHAIFVAALAMEPERRAGYLAEACAGDVALLAQAERLLAAAQTSAGFLESPALGGGGARAHAGPPEVRGYRLVRVLGVGGMASVYEAEQHHPRRRVALKVMHISLARTSALQRFRFETEVLARLTHPGIAQIYEAGTCESTGGHPAPFFAMEFVEDAKPVTAYARDLALPPRARLALFAEVCDAVQYGHQLGVIHRDLKPGNVLVDRAGRAKVIDFGVARSVEPSAERITRHEGEGQLIGTLNAMSPEQASGDQRIDTRTDVYALGVILYELVTDRLPHDLSRASLPEAVRIIQSLDPPRPGSLVPEARGDLDAIILKAMDKDPQRRYDGAGSLAADIRRYLSSRTVLARMPSPWHHARLFTRRHRALVAAVGAVLLTVLCASVLTGWFAYRSWRDSLQRLAAEQTAIVERDAARRQQYSASIASAYLSYQAGEVARGRQRLDAASSLLRGWEWGLISALLESDETVIPVSDMVLAMSARPESRRLATAARDGTVALWGLDGDHLISQVSAPDTGPALAVALTPDGRTVYAGFDDGSIREWRPDSSDGLRTITTGSAPIRGLDCSASGFLAAADGDGAARILSAGTGTVIHRFDDQPGEINGLRFSENGARLLTWGADGSVWLREVSTWGPLTRMQLGGRVGMATLSESGELVAAGGAEGRLCVWDVASGAAILETTASPSATTVLTLAFAPDGTTLYEGRVDRSISAWRVAPGSQPTLVGRHDEAVSALFMDEATSRLISASWDRTIRQWPIGDNHGSGPKSALHAHEDHILSTAFSPAGDLLASGGRDNVVNLWEPQLGLKLATLRGHSGDIYAVRFSPDGRRLASASTDGTVRIWSTWTGECEAILGPAQTALWTVSFSPDGARLAAAGDAGHIVVWDLSSKTIVLDIAAHSSRVLSVAFDPDGGAIASCSRDGTVGLWSAADGSPLHSLSGHRLDVFACAFSPDGARLFTGSRDQTVRVWDPRTGAAVATLDCRGQFITSLSIDAEGKRLAAGSWFSEIIVWDVSSLEQVFAFKGNSAAIRGLAFSPVAPILACGGHDGVLTIWNGQPGAERRAAQEVATSRLAAAESALAQTRQPSPQSPADDPTMSAEDLGWLRKAALRQRSAAAEAR